MTDDQLYALCLAADPLDYWGDVTAWRPASLCAPPGPRDPLTVVRLAIIPPIAGGSPGLVADIINAIRGIVWRDIIRPVINWFVQTIFNAVAVTASGLDAWARALLYSVWRWWQDLWWPYMWPYFAPHGERHLQPSQVSVLTIITSLFRYPALGILSRIMGWVYWLRDRVNGVWENLKQWHRDLRTMVNGWITSARNHLAQWHRDLRTLVYGWVIAAKNHLVQWIADTRTLVFGWVTAAKNHLAQWVADTRTLVYGWVNAARDFVVERIFGTVMAGAASLVEGLRDAFDFVFEKIAAAIRYLKDGLVAGFQQVFIGPVDSLVNTVNRKLAIPGRLIRGEYANLGAFLDDLVDPGPAVIAGVVGVIILGVVISMVTASIMSVLVEPLTEPYVQNVRAGVGVQLLQPPTLQEARNREIVDDGLVDDHLSRAGYSGSAKEVLKELRHHIPGYGDLVRFAVREAFDPGLADSLGFVTPLPGDFALWMERQGFEEEWAQRYWWAHWDLPSVTQGFEMLHRGVINLEELKQLLRAQDVAPLWQDRFVEIAYTLPSRVDLRRMLKADIITETDVLKGYTDRGYDDFWARALTDFAVDWSTPDDESEVDELRELTASQIRLAYRRNVIDRNEALDRLVAADHTEGVADFLLAVDDAQIAKNPYIDSDVDVRELTRAVILDAYSAGIWDRDRTQAELEAQGYLPGSADLLLSLKDVANARSLTKAQTDLVRQRYVTRQIGDAAARADLGALEIPVARRELLVAEWAVDRQAGTRALSLSQIRNALKEGLIDQDGALERTLGLGYSLEDATIIRVLDKPELEAARELSRSLVERLLRAGQLTEAQAVDRLEVLGFTEGDARDIIDSTVRQMERGLVERLLKQDVIDRNEALDRLTRAGYSPQDAELVVLSVEAKEAESV